jgi:hypothetical protein
LPVQVDQFEKSEFVRFCNGPWFGKRVVCVSMVFRVLEMGITVLVVNRIGNVSVRACARAIEDSARSDFRPLDHACEQIRDMRGQIMDSQMCWLVSSSLAGESQ